MNSQNEQAQPTIQRFISDVLHGTTDLTQRPELQRSEPLMTARGTLRFLHDNFAQQVERRGLAAVSKELTLAVARIGEVLRGLDASVWAGKAEAQKALMQALRRLRREARGLAVNRRIPARPLLGFLPLARVIPQDVHSVLDYTGGLSVLGGALFDPGVKRSALARGLGIGLGASAVGVSLFTDYRLSLFKLVPIEVHEAIDYTWSLANILSPFVLGTWKKAPILSIIQVSVGATNLIGSLLTDYRAARGPSQPGIGAQPEPQGQTGHIPVRVNEPVREEPRPGSAAR